MKAKQKTAKIEVRRDPPTRRHPEGDIDEICGTGTFHLERVDSGLISLMLYGEAGDTMSVWLEPKRQPTRASRPHIQARVVWHEVPAKKGSR